VETFSGHSDISIAVPIFRNHQFLEETIRGTLHHNLVSDFVLIDDATPGLEFSGLVEEIKSVLARLGLKNIEDRPLPKDKLDIQNLQYRVIRWLDAGKRKKLTIGQNAFNIGAFQNKLQTLKMAENDWVYLLDADNVIGPDLLNRICEYFPWDPDLCYCPAILNLVGSNQAEETRARPQLFGISRLHDIGLPLPFFSKLLKSKVASVVEEAHFFLNTGNFFVFRKRYIEVCKPAEKPSFPDPSAADVIAFAYFWLASQNRFFLMENTNYAHRLHEESIWRTRPSASEANYWALRIRRETAKPTHEEFNLSLKAISAVKLYGIRHSLSRKRKQRRKRTFASMARTLSKFFS
jgi:GT2 family glycosyltransferase